jgi:hypothetical protein
VLLFVAVIALLGALSPALRWLSTRGAGGVVFGNFGELSGALLWTFAIAGVGLLAALSARSSARAGIGVAIVLILAAAFGYRFVWSRFVAVSADGSRIVLRYVFPRPRSVIEAAEIRSAEIVHATEDENDMSIHLYRLEIETARGRRVSQPTLHSGELERALAMVHRAARTPVAP